jgi:hypothetical protein
MVIRDRQERSTFDVIMKVAMIVFFLLAFVFNISPETKEMRNLFIALAWVVFVTRETGYFFSDNKALRCFIGILVAAPLAPLGVTFIVSGMDAMKAYLGSIGAEQTWSAIKKCFGGMGRIIDAIGQGSASNLQQGDSFYVVIGGFTIALFICFVFYGACVSLKQKPVKVDVE